MDRDFVKALLLAWQRPEFRAALKQVVDLDEVLVLLAALAEEDRDHRVKRGVLGLVRSALETGEVRRVVLMAVEDDGIRAHVSAGLGTGLAERPGLARSVRSALDDPRVRREVRAAMESAQLRALIWQAADDQLGNRRLALVGDVLRLAVVHGSARRLAWALRRHGVLGELRRGDGAA